MRKYIVCIILLLLLTISACGKEKLADGDYKIDITLEGGSGRASLASPTDMSVRNGKRYIKFQWSSPNYDYMIVDGHKYFPINDEGDSVFEIPIASIEEPIAVIADTTAMSTPHEIEYTISFGEYKEPKKNKAEETEVTFDIPKTLGSELTWLSKYENKYATGFSIDYYGTADSDTVYKLLTIQNEGQFLVIPEGKTVPADISTEITSIYEPSSIYLSASAVMDMFEAINSLDTVKYCSLPEDEWYIEGAKTSMQAGDMVYAGRYSAPDYEMMLDGGCDLAIENTMIYHSPEVKEKLESFGITVLVDRSSYEEEPLGRAEWVKLYGALLGKEKLAIKRFNKQLKKYNKITVDKDAIDKPTVAFFYVASNGSIKVRKTADYIPKMIDMAGGEYVFSNIGDDDMSFSSTVTIQMEQFYAMAKDADYLIYNSTIDGELECVDDLIEKNDMFSKFKAVSEGKVYCTSANLYQSSMEVGTIINDMNKMLNGEPKMKYIYHLE